LAFEVTNLDDEVKELERLGIAHEPIRMDEITNRRFLFLKDPDDLPIELYER
jgi:glyoxylase I family protein